MGLHFKLVLLLLIQAAISKECPDEMPLTHTSNNFEAFLNDKSMRERAMAFIQLPKSITSQVATIFAYVKKLNKIERLSENHILDSKIVRIVVSIDVALNKYSHCMNLPENAIFLFSNLDSLSTKKIDSLIAQNPGFVHQSCMGNPDKKQCTKDYIFNTINEAPIFLFQKRLGKSKDSEEFYLEFNKPLLPEMTVFDPNNEIQKLEDKIAWEDKKAKIFWRGAFYFNTDQKVNEKDCIDFAYRGLLPRQGLLIEKFRYPHMIDAVFSSFLVTDPMDCDDAILDYLDDNFNYCKFCNKTLSYIKNAFDSEEILFTREHRNKQDHFEYKYLISIDGPFASGGRVPWILKSNSLLLKQDSDMVEWFDGELVDGLHYKSIPRDFKFEDFMSWARENDTEAKRIAMNGNYFFDVYFTQETANRVVYSIVKDYLDYYDSKNREILDYLRSIKAW